jgi:hypothetical protein
MAGGPHHPSFLRAKFASITTQSAMIRCAIVFFFNPLPLFRLVIHLLLPWMFREDEEQVNYTSSICGPIHAYSDGDRGDRPSA